MNLRKTISILFLVLICLLLSGCTKTYREKKKITKNAIEYFAQKYNFNKDDIDISYNGLYGIEGSGGLRCLDSCGDNQMKIFYDGKEYLIKYNISDDSFGDDYQYNDIYNDLYNYLVNKFSFATTIKIDSLTSDVLRTSAKYNYDIVDYVKNVIRKEQFGDTTKISTFIRVWIEVNDSNKAKELHEKYKKELITELDNLDTSYSIAFSNKETSNEYTSFYYYSVINGGRKPAFMFWDKVDNDGDNYLATKTCNSKYVIFDDAEIICK